MIDAETLRVLRLEIRKQVQIILSGQSGGGDVFNETINNLLPGMDGIPDRPVMHPYGLGSVAPKGTIQVTARQGEHPGNRLILGHRDANIPPVNSGEVILYNQYGQQIYLENGKIHIGTKATSNPAPVGNELLAMLTEFINDYKAHQHIGNLGAPTPLMATDVTKAEDLLANHITNKKIVSSYIFIDKGG